MDYEKLAEKKEPTQRRTAILIIVTAVSLVFIIAFLVELLKFKNLNENFIEIIDYKNLNDWNVFKAKFGKVYEDSDSERVHYLNFLENRKAINVHNQKFAEGLVSYFKGINQYSDMTYEEMRKHAFGFKYNKQFDVNRYARVHKPILREPPDSVDWRTEGVVTPVKDQKDCGSCWAFSTTGVLEGQHALATRKLVSLSEQQLIDCSKPEGNYGCAGGWPFDAYIYIISVSQGLDTESSYPYAGVDEDCAFDPSNIGANATAFAVLTPGDENILKEAVANVGPISVAIETTENFHSYGGGVYDDPECHSDIDHMTHAVLVVGYGTDSETGKDYWLVKNSWNTSWGEEGYIKMVRNKKNQCAIATLASYMTVQPMLK